MKKSYLNKKYGKLTVIRELEPSNGKNNGGKWLCKCDCGNEIEIKGYSLNWNNSCGCLIKEGKLRGGLKSRKYEQVTISHEHTTHRGNCHNKRRGYLPKENWLRIVFLPCHYCGEIDERNYAKTGDYIKKYGATLTSKIMEKYTVKMNGVDRVDSSKGYLDEGNSVPCCKMCNRMKNEFTKEEFLNKIKKIYNKITS